MLLNSIIVLFSNSSSFVDLFTEVKTIINVGLFYNIKVIEDTVRHHEEFSSILSSKVLCL